MANEKAQLRKNALSKFIVKYVFINFDICKIYFLKGVSIVERVETYNTFLDSEMENPGGFQRFIFALIQQ